MTKRQITGSVNYMRAPFGGNGEPKPLKRGGHTTKRSAESVMQTLPASVNRWKTKCR